MVNAGHIYGTMDRLGDVIGMAPRNSDERSQILNGLWNDQINNMVLAGPVSSPGLSTNYLMSVLVCAGQPTEAAWWIKDLNSNPIVLR